MRSPKSENCNRRRFLGQASCASVGSLAAYASILNLKLTGSLSAAESDSTVDYKALVCVFLAGGNDSFNMLVPSGGPAYSDYAETRSSLALTPDEISPFVNALPDGRRLGLSSAMPGLRSLYESGKAAFVANVGTLVEPTTALGIENGTVDLPLGLYSHSDQQLHWQSALPDTRSPGSGWGGRLADKISSFNGESGVSMNLSLAGTNVFQSSTGTGVFSKSPGILPGIKDWDLPVLRPRRAAIESVLESEYENVFKKVFAGRTNEAISASDEYRSALEGIPDMTSTFSEENAISQQLKDVVETILARDGLSKRRQTFFVKAGGWDLHSSLDPHGAMLGQLSEAVSEFQTAIEEFGLEREVTLFTASDFGRTLTDNGGGSDHGWGGNQFVVGGAVQGGRVFGEYPDLALGNPLDVGRGRLIPTLSVDEYLADLALWMGVSPSNLEVVLPNLSRFSDVILGGAPLGLFGAGSE